MAKYCEECGQKLSFRNSFVYESRNLCKECLNMAKYGEGGDRINKASKLSANSFNGTGTRYYGRWDAEIEGQQVVIRTMFASLFYIPIVPILSALIYEEGESEGWFIGIAGSSKKKFLATKIPIFWPQALTIYNVMAIVIGVLYALLIWSEGHTEFSYILGVFPALLIIPCVLYLTYHKSLKSANNIIAVSGLLLNIINIMTIVVAVL